MSRFAAAAFIAILSCLAQQPSKISPELAARVAAMPGEERLPVFIVLAYQPQPAILAAVAMDAGRERGMTTQERQLRIRLGIEREIRPMQDRLLSTLMSGGARRTGVYAAINMITAEIPLSMLPTLEADPAVSLVFLAEVRHADNLSLSVPATGAPIFWGVGRTGAGASIALVDTGVRTDHPAFAGRNIVHNTFLSFGPVNACFDDDASTPQDLGGHGTHIAGILMGQGSTGFSDYLGVAKGLATLYNLKTAYRTKSTCPPSNGGIDDRDLIRALEWAALNTPSKIINLSFGGKANGDGDDPFTKTVDLISDIYDAFIAVAAGNAGPARTTVETPAIGYNVVSVANWNFQAGRTISDTSSRGPTVENRFKPDIAAPGVGISSANIAWEGRTDSTDDYTTKSGTSMATPHVAGAAALLASAGVNDPLQMKAILLNTTGDPNWLADRGWGFINLARAQPQVAFRDSVLLQRGGSQLYAVSAPGPFSATITWNRHIDGPELTPRFNNLNLRVFSRTSGAILGSSNAITQNVEKVVLPNSADDLVVRVDTAAPNPSIEFYGIAMSSAFTRVSGPLVSAACSPSALAFVGIPFPVSCTVTNRGDVPAFGLDVSGVRIPVLAAGASATVNPMFTGDSLGIGAFNASVTGTNYGDTLSLAIAFTVTLAAPPPPPAAITAGTYSNGVLSWTASSGASSYDVYLGTENPPTFLSNTTSTSLRPTLSGGVTYFWRVVARNAGGSAASSVLSFTAAPSTGLRFVPIQPCRLFDTRETEIIEAQATRVFSLAANPCVAPVVPAAYSLNVSVVPEASLGYLTVWPAGQAQPLVATLNSLDGRIKANAAIVPAGLDGAINVFATDRTHVIVDINGYFVPEEGLAYYPVTPCRVASSFLAPAETSSFAVLSTCGIPSAARAYALNATVTPYQGLPFGYLTLWPSGQPQPVVSTLNAVTGTPTANFAIVQAGVNGEVSAYGSDAGELVLDIHGYFAPAGSVGALTFRPVAPCRLLDTRLNGGPLSAGTPRDIPPGCATTDGLYALNVTVVPDGPLETLKLGSAGILTATDGAITSNAALIPSGRSLVSSANGTHLILDLFGVFLP